MATRNEKFFESGSFAVAGHSAKSNFPKLSYGELKKSGKTVFAVDPSKDTIAGDKTYPDFASLPEKVEAAIIEVPKEETAAWVGKAAEAGIGRVWVHMGRETPEAQSLAEEKGIELHTGSCAVMYLVPGFSMHSPHRWIWKLLGKY